MFGSMRRTTLGCSDSASSAWTELQLHEIYPKMVKWEMIHINSNDGKGDESEMKGVHSE